MKKKLYSYLTMLVLIALFAACDKDGDKIVISDNPTAPTLVTIPDLNFHRDNAANELIFIGTKVDPGFTASANYFIEACAKGTNFDDVAEIWTGINPESIKMTVGDVNGALLKKFPEDKTSSLDLRLKAVLVLDAGATGKDPMEYSSETKSVDATIYGYPKLDLIGSGVEQKVLSHTGNGKYTGFVMLDPTKPFTLSDPEANIKFGGVGDNLSVNGLAITADVSGWNKMDVDTIEHTYSLQEFKVGLIGSATPNGWEAPDSKMEYIPAKGVWSITLDLIKGEIKFRVNDNWSGAINLGLGDDANPQYTLSNLWNNGSSQNIPIKEDGNYTILLDIGASKYSATITKNE